MSINVKNKGFILIDRNTDEITFWEKLEGIIKIRISEGWYNVVDLEKEKIHKPNLSKKWVDLPKRN